MKAKQIPRIDILDRIELKKALPLPTASSRAVQPRT